MPLSSFSTKYVRITLLFLWENKAYAVHVKKQKANGVKAGSRMASDMYSSVNIGKSMDTTVWSRVQGMVGHRDEKWLEECSLVHTECIKRSVHTRTVIRKGLISCIFRIFKKRGSDTKCFQKISRGQNVYCT